MLSNARKSVFVGVDIALGVWLRFSRSPERQQGLADTNCRAEQYRQYPQVQFAGRCGGGVPKPERLQDGDGTGGRTGWPAVIRGRRQQDRGRRGGSTGKCSSRYPAVKSVSSTSVKASAADARTGRFGSGVPSQSRRRTGDGAGCRRAALPQAAQQYAVPVGRSTSSSHHRQYAVPQLQSVDSRGKNGGAEHHQDRPGRHFEPGYRRTSIVRWSPVKQPRSQQPRHDSRQGSGNRRPAQ